MELTLMVIPSRRLPLAATRQMMAGEASLCTHRQLQCFALCFGASMPFGTC
jgi:hypothetical protein